MFNFSYDPEQDRWFLVQPMHAKRLGVGVVVVNRLLYAVGGFNGTERLATVECYHPENNEWSFVKPMTYGRSGAGVAAINQFIYVVGGFDGTRQLSSVERYDTENQVWEQVAPIKIARSALSLTSLDGKLYAIGGFDGSSFLSIVEVYDPKTNTWEQGTPLSSGRSGHASAVIYQPSCVTNFMDCIEEDSSKHDPGANEDQNSDDNPNSLPGNSRCSGNGGPTSSIGFHTSYGSSGCRNCEEEINISPSDNEEDIPVGDTKKYSALVLNENSSEKSSYRRWCKKTRKLRKPSRQMDPEITETSTFLSSNQLPSLPRSDENSQETECTAASTSRQADSSEHIDAPSSTKSKRKCKFAQCKSQCFTEAIRKCTNGRTLVNDFLQCLLEKHAKKIAVI